MKYSRCGSSAIIKNGSTENGKKEAFNMSSNGKIFIKADEMRTFVGDKDNDALDMACFREKDKAYCGISCWKKK